MYITHVIQQPFKMGILTPSVMIKDLRLRELQ